MLASSRAAPTAASAQRQLSRSRPLPAPAAAPLRHRNRRPSTHTTTVAAASSSSSPSFQEQAARFADSTQQRMQEFVRQQKLDEKAADASRAAQDNLRKLSEETSQNARRAFMKIESEHNISGRLRRTQSWLSEAARDIDQEWSLRQRLRSALEDTRRMLPQWRRQLAEFSETPLGKGSLALLFVGLLFSGLLWQLLNAAWLLWWVSIPVSLVLAQQRGKAAAAAAQQAAEQEQARQAAGPFGGWGRRSSSGTSGAAGRGGSNAYSSSEGPIVEAEWTSLDSGDDDSGSGGRRWR